MKNEEKTKLGDPTYFICTCSEEGKKEAKFVLNEVKKLLEADDSNLVTKIIYSLNWAYGAQITSIGCDMWCQIDSKTYKIDETTKEPIFFTEIQCDQIEDGMATTWYAYYKKFGLKTDW